MLSASNLCRVALMSLAIFCAAQGAIQAQQRAAVTGAPQDASVGILRDLEAKYADVKSVSGSFTQEREDKTFGKKFTEPATFSLLKPSHFRVNYTGTEPSEVLISGQKSYNFVPKLKQASVYTFKGGQNVRDLNYLLLGFGAKTDDVLAVYSVKSLPSGKGMQLTPKDRSQAQFKYITMELSNDEKMLPVRFNMEQTDGSMLSVKVNTGSLKLNPSLGPRDFEPDFPKGTNMVDMR